MCLEALRMGNSSQDKTMHLGTMLIFYMPLFIQNKHDVFETSNFTLQPQ